MSANQKILSNEKELFTRMANGDEAAFADIFFHYIPVLQPHLLKLTRSEDLTQDIIHDTFLKLWLARDKMNEIENYRSYIFTISTNRTYDILRKKSTERIALSKLKNNTPVPVNTTEEMVDLNTSAGLISEAVQQLPPKQKLVFKLSREEGLSHDEIAARLNISKSTVSNHLTDALRSIKEYLQKNPGVSGLSLLSIILSSKIL